MAPSSYTSTLPYHNAALDFAPFASLARTFFLDSSLQLPGKGRYSFWGIQPLATLQTKEGFVTLNQHTRIDSPIPALKGFYAKIKDLPSDPYHPFQGGLIGYLSYEWGAALENIPLAPIDPSLDLPDCWFGLFDTVVSYDHIEKICRVSSFGLDEDLKPNIKLARERAEELMGKILNNRKEDRVVQTNGSCKPAAVVTPMFEKLDYLKAIQKILDYLKAGDCYQVNLSQCFRAQTNLSSWELYQNLRKISPAPYSCFLQTGSFQILSSSPESFLESFSDGTLTTQPIKGTRKRGETSFADESLKKELLESSKDQAELMMITDLERNDLGKICQAGSVAVTHLKKCETFPQVHHLISVVSGKKMENLDLIDVLQALLPGGSITGAPKIRAMQIIQELEPVQRGIYTGVIGWLGPQNTASLNIAIRTMIMKENLVSFHTGGGIVIDSDPKKEYEETLTKAKGMMEAL